MLAALVHLLLIGALFPGSAMEKPGAVFGGRRGLARASSERRHESGARPGTACSCRNLSPSRSLFKVEPTTPSSNWTSPSRTTKEKGRTEKPEPKKEEPRKPEPKKEEAKKPESRREVPDFKKQLEQDLKTQERVKAAAQAAQDHRALADAELKQLGQTRGNQAAAARKAGEDKYRAALSGKIRGNIVLPPSIKGNPEAVFKITQLPSGEIIDVKIIKSSGNKALDEAIERAIRKLIHSRSPNSQNYSSAFLN